MPLMVGKCLFTRLYTVLGVALRQFVLRETAYPVQFIVSLIGKSLRVTLILVFFQTIVLRLPPIPHWGQTELSILALTYFLIDLVASVFFQRSLLYYLPRSIQDGSFDQYLVRPISPLFQVATREVDLYDLLTTIPVVGYGMWVLAHAHVQIGLMQLAAYGIWVLVGLVFVFALVLIIGSVSFWTFSTNLGRMVDLFASAGQFPLDVFPRSIKRLTFYVLPIAALATIPTQVLFGTASVFDRWYVFGFTLCSVLLGLRLWQAGVQRYESASS